MNQRFRLVLLLLVLILAAGLRFYRIDAQSFWNDEGNSARLAERSLDLILEGARGDIHPPGYYLALHYWRALWGRSETALRGFSAACSVLIALATFGLGRRLFDEDSTLLGAALIAINPFQVYYAQEARMYAALALWAAASTWALVEWLTFPEKQGASGKRRTVLLIYVLTVAAGLYTHYAFPFVLLAQGLGVGLWLWATRERRGLARRLLILVCALGAAALLYLPWLPTAWHQVTTWPSAGESFALLPTLAGVFRLLTLGTTVATEAAIGGLAALALFVCLSAFPPIQSGEEEQTPYHIRWALLTLLALAPVGLILGLGLYKPAYQKFLLVASAPLSLLVGRGVLVGWRLASGVGMRGQPAAPSRAGYRGIIVLLAGLALLDSGRSLHNLYFDPAFARADYRAIAQQLLADARPDDAIILNAPNQWEVFTYYYPDGENIFPLARQRPLDKAQNQAELETIVTNHRRIFAIYWGDVESDPDRFVEGWLEQHTYKASEIWFGDVRLAIYAAPLDSADAPASLLDARFGRDAAQQSIILDGYSLLTPTPRPGDILQLALFWRALEPIPERYKVFVHIYNPAGQLVAQTDSEPGATLRPTNTWSPDETIVDRYGVLIPPDTPAGDYGVVVGLYPISDPNTRLVVYQAGEQVGDHLTLSPIHISP